MKISGMAAIVTGGGSGLGEATARALAAEGAKVAIFDVNEAAARAVAAEIGGIGIGVNVSDATEGETAFAMAAQSHGTARILVNCAGVAPIRKILSKQGRMPLDDYRRGIEINLVGSFNMLSLFADAVQHLAALEDNERGVVVNTASVAAYEGQIGQTSYASSKAGVVGLTLPAARELAPLGIRVCAIAPGIFETPMLRTLSEAAQASLGMSVPFPQRLGYSSEYASLAIHIIENRMINGETVRLDGALRMAAR
ncbi:SDR family NAD(P)-dependent oxidoreductase (plasmid) [Agrobacterium leguminum]|uniref:3-hydroxyacyl-CoA dehydrogenase (Short-chain) n=1 Tax=Agrobacterium deltaense NCPPB 1641 TaxID=1183425 RepID=A0A1S7U6T7_9HYPH|nr:MULTISPECIES: SDR family NAD(P)-dependent oxidoreductase [Agrobacterium]WFS69814.1 SDR family NAD(P)-dependent oxidoreductase [Agrobacterium leguminum]CVI62626.1 3-hydroxyacyl-CoA dehydrogenase (short-chain) [Agrobacterium deltaense NCPPB 1641]